MSDASSWDAFADGWDDDPAAIAYSEAAFRSLGAALATRDIPFDGLRVLDFGCGTGLLTQRLVARVAAIDALDTSPAMLEVLCSKAEQAGWVNVRVLGELPLGERYDLIVASSVCSFLEDYPAAITQLTSLLSPGGAFVQWDWEQDPADADPHGLTRVGVSDALRAAGLEQVVVETAFEVRVGDSVMAPLIGVGSKPSR